MHDQLTSPQITQPADVVALVRKLTRKEPREIFFVFLLNARHIVVQTRVVSIGTLNASLVHPREVFHPAIKYPCAAVLLSHNHPSGEATPSDDDVAITRRLIQAGELLGIPVLDHVVVTQRGYVSFREGSLM